ncbi:MAG: TerC family protein [Cytophagales bacterium]|nr:TerC family protein [Cytophagales bacterium]
MQIVYWVLFVGLIIALLLLDLLVVNRENKKVTIRAALLWSVFWIALSLSFNVLVYFWKGQQPALEFLTGYLIEKSLSVDNLFVFLVIFTFFKVPDEYQHKVLFWGILGALVFRALFIFLGISLLERFHFFIYILGAFLVYAGVKLVVSNEEVYDPNSSRIYRWLRKILPILKDFKGDAFFVLHGGKLFFTPLFVVLVLIETTDIMFALDSIPAILAVSKDPFIVFSSNIFAILGLRALYFALAGIMGLFHYLKYALAIVLSFIGVKIIIADYFHIPTPIALSVVGGVLVLSIILSFLFPKPEEEEVQEPSKEALDV